MAAHCRGVAALCAGFAEPQGLAAMGRLLGLLHDMGKLSDAFQAYMEEAIRREKDGLPPPAPRVDHGKDGAALILERYHKGSPSKQYAAEILALCVGWHHGGLPDFIDPDAADPEKRIPLLRRCVPDGQYAESRERFFAEIAPEAELDALFDQAAGEMRACLSPLKRDAGHNAQFQLHLLVKLLYSCLVDADRTDTLQFEAKLPPESAEASGSLWPVWAARVAARQTEFRGRTQASPTREAVRLLRCEIADRCRAFAARETGIYTLTVPTGGGKTLSSLWYALEHARIHGKKRIVYVVPYTTIIEQNAREVRELLECGDDLLEFHSHVLVRDDSEVESGRREEDPSLKLLTERWDRPIIFTTMVQFLDTIYAAGTQKIRRFHQLADAVLIFDEVQSVPTKCLSLFNEALYFLKKYMNTTSILCSATQPELGLVKRPLRPDGEMIPDAAEKFAAFRRVSVESRLRQPMSAEAMAEKLAALTEAEGSVLAVTNTVASAEALFRAVTAAPPPDTQAYYLSTRLCPAHRQTIFDEIRRALDMKKRVVCISTKLIEAGVDLSFGTVVRFLAGLDSVAQAAGRCNRHGEQDLAHAFVVRPERENLAHMPDLAAGIAASQGIFNTFSSEPERFDGDLLSPSAIAEYYRYYFGDTKMQEKMDYPHDGTSLFALLSGMNVRDSYRKSSRDGGCPLQLGLRFGAASKAFRVIEDDTRAVVVPCGPGKELAERWLSDCTLRERQALLRQMQPYCVNLYDYQVAALENARALTLHEGILLLNDAFYDPRLGVVTVGRALDFMDI